MERETANAELIELGTASTDTLGVPIGAVPEREGFYTLGLDQE